MTTFLKQAQLPSIFGC